MGVVTKEEIVLLFKTYFYWSCRYTYAGRDIPKTINFIRDVCYQMIDDKFDLNMFVISKTLKGIIKILNQLLIEY